MTDQDRERAITRRRAIALMGVSGLAAVDAACANGGRESTLAVSKHGEGWVGALTMGVRSS